MPARSRWNKDPVLVTDIEAAEFTIDSPLGPLTVTYSHKGTDRFVTKFRGQEYSATVLDTDPDGPAYQTGLRDQIADAEEDYQEKRAREKARKAATKEPIPAYRWTPDGLVRIYVRGVDQRSGKALITTAMGEKDQAHPHMVLRDLNESEKADLIALQRAVERTNSRVADCGPRDASDVLEGVEVDLAVRLDLDTMERVAVHDGVEYRAASAADIEKMVRARLVYDAGWKFMEARDDQANLIAVPVLGDEKVRSSASLFRDEAHFAEYLAAVAVAGDARRVLSEALAEYRFDLSQFAALPEENS